MKRIVLLTGSDVQHRYVAKTLAERPGLVGIVATEQPRVSLPTRLRRAIRRFGFAGLISRGLLKLAMKLSGEDSRRRAELNRVLGDPNFPDGVPIFKTIGVNSPETQKVLRELAPDILCVYGTYLVSDATLATAKQIALNLHTGISPRYRGADCEFWPLHNRELQFIGATVHACTPEVDGGGIYGTVRATLESQDRLGAVFGRCVVAGSALYKRVTDDFANGRDVKTMPQDLSSGKEYKVAMRGWRAELRVARLLRQGIVRDFSKAQSKKLSR